MTDRSKLLALAEAVEKLTGPDRETDARIAHAIKWRWDDWAEGDLCIESYTVEAVIDRSQNSHNSIWQHLPRFTGSMDAAMTLVPEGWQTLGVEQSHDGAEWIWRLYPAYRSDSAVFGQSTTPALALTAACLRARAQAEALA